MALRLVVNGAEKMVETIDAGASLTAFVATLGFRPDRVAVERNGEIVPRAEWPACSLVEDDKLEVVHFVGGGCGPLHSS